MAFWTHIVSAQQIVQLDTNFLQCLLVLADQLRLAKGQSFQWAESLLKWLRCFYVLKLFFLLLFLFKHKHRPNCSRGQHKKEETLCPEDNSCQVYYKHIYLYVLLFPAFVLQFVQPVHEFNKTRGNSLLFVAGYHEDVDCLCSESINLIEAAKGVPSAFWPFPAPGRLIWPRVDQSECFLPIHKRPVEMIAWRIKCLVETTSFVAAMSPH